MKHDLAVLEAALRDGRATASDPAERELQELALALRADSPEPDPRFADELSERVKAGFPRAGRAAKARAGAPAGSPAFAGRDACSPPWPVQRRC